MVRTDISLYIVLIFFTAHVGSTCVSEECKNCSESLPGLMEDNNCNCNLSVTVNSTGSDVEEGQDVTLTFVNLYPMPEDTCKPMDYTWLKDGKIIKDETKEKLVLKQVLSPNAGKYICMVKISCGCIESLPHQVTVKNNSLILILICGVSAVCLVVIMGLIMKFKLKRDNEKHKERRRQQAQTGPAAGPNPFTPRPHS